MINALRPSKKVFFAYLILPLAFYTFIVIVPIVMAVYNSFFDWPGGTLKTFTGLENYKTLLHDKVFWLAFRNNLLLTAVCLVGQIGLAFIFALILNTKSVLFKNLHRTFAYFPATVSAVVVGFVWSIIFDYNYGLINYFLKFIGRPDLTQAWLSDPKHVMLYVSIPVIWQYVGYYLIIILAGFSSIDKSILESAELDGANAFQRARFIILPLMRNILAICVTLCIAGNMKAFDHIYTMTGGGPFNSSNVMALYGYNVSFTQYKMGYGNAVSIGILILSLTIVGLGRLIPRLVNRRNGGARR